MELWPLAPRVLGPLAVSPRGRRQARAARGSALVTSLTASSFAVRVQQAPGRLKGEQLRELFERPEV